MKKTWMAIFAAACFAAETSSAQTVRTFVSSVNGSDSNPCTRPLPCRNFNAAISAVAAGGEVVALDTGGYGPVSVTESVALIGSPGIHAAIAPTSGTAVSVNAGGTDVVWIRNLYLNSQGASHGINMTGGAALHVQNVVASGFASEGLNVNTAAEIFVADSVFRNNLNTGILVQAPSGIAKATVERTHLNSNGNGSGIGSCGGMTAGTNSRVTASETMAAGNFRGFQAIGPNADLILDRSTAAFGVVGIFAYVDGTTTIRVSNSTVTGNSLYGIEAQGTSQILSRVNNTVIANAAAETFSGTFAGK